MDDYEDIDSMSDDYTDQLLIKFNPNYKSILEILDFERMNINDKLMYLFTELRDMKVSGEMKSKKSVFNLF